jgi:uncharacterized protein (TIGR02186 family)
MNGRARRPKPILLLGLALAVFLALGAAAKAADIVADLTSHLIAIGSGFTGASVVLFGAIEPPGDVVAVVRGPSRETTIWRKGKVAGVWVNTESVTFDNVPSFYTVAASRPLDQVLSPDAAALYRIGTANLQLKAASADPGKVRRFADALIAEQQQGGLFGTSPLKIGFLGERLFRTSIGFPANVPTGSYLVEVFLVHDRDIVGGQTIPLVVSKVGLDAAVSDFASRQSAAYGVIAVVTALVAGWLASLPFRGV